MTRVQPRSTVLWSALIALLVVGASVEGLLEPRVYAEETENWATQAKGQDLGNLLAVVVLLVAAVRHRRGSRSAGLVWIGAMLYLVYAFIVYAVAVHLNDLFLVYVAVLGLSAWGIIFHVGDIRAAASPPPPGRARTVAAWVLIATGVLFAALWLSELIPALLTGSVPASLTEAGLPVNPIHVIDLSMVLPGFVLCGVAALQGREHGLFWLAPWLVFSVLMGSSIIAGMLLMARTDPAAAIPPAVMVGIVVVASLLAVRASLRGGRARIEGAVPPPPPPSPT